MTREHFSELMVRYERLVYTICFQLVRDAAAAEDLTQDTFLSAYIHRSSMPPGYERQWLGRIAANKAKDHLQSAWSRRTVLPGDEEMPPGLAPPAEEVALHRFGAGTGAASERPPDACAAIAPDGSRTTSSSDREPSHRSTSTSARTVPDSGSAVTAASAMKTSAVE